MSVNAQLVYTRLPNEDQGGYLKFPAYLVSKNIALAIFDAHIEVHKVESTSDGNEFDLVEQSNPMFYVGDDVRTVFMDINNLTMVEFARKYEHGDLKK